MENDLVFRIYDPKDSLEEINALLRISYQPLAEMGMRFAASREGVEATRSNIEDGECHLAILDDKIVSCIVLRLPNSKNESGWKSEGPSWYQNPAITTFGRFAVHPSFQKIGIGTKMMDRIEPRACALGYSELALDTSEHAHHLIKMYSYRGYRHIGYHRWQVGCRMQPASV